MSAFKKHFDAIVSGRIERGNIIGIRKGLNAWERRSRGYSTSRINPGFTTPEADELTQAIFRHHPVATGALHDGGLKVLRNPRYAKRWTPDQRHVIDNLRRFELVRFDWIGPQGAQCVPVYRAVSDYVDRDGVPLAFTFRNIPWQSAWTMGEEDGPRVVPE